MKKFLRGLGIALMIFNGIGFIAILLNVGALVTGMEGPILMRILSIILFFLMFGGLFFLGYKIWKKNQVPPEKAKGDERAMEAPSNPEAAVRKVIIPSSNPEIQTLPGADAAYYTIIANYLELPFHDGDRFFLIKDRSMAEEILAASGRKNLYIRELHGALLKRELSEYLCCGYTGAIVKKAYGALKEERDDILLNQEDLIRHFELPDMKQHGNITPALLRRMHNYLNQIDYTKRKYGTNPVPEFWQTHLKGYKDDVIRLLLNASLCLPSSKDAAGKITFSVLAARMPNGDHWAALFTDQYAISRYMRLTKDSIVFPGLVSDVAKDLRSGKMKDMKGIMINPGREEFRMTVDEISAQEEARRTKGSGLIGNQRQDGEGNGLIGNQRQESDGNGQIGNNSLGSGDRPLEEMMPAASEKQMRGFFKGLLPGERAESNSYLSEPDPEDAPTAGFISVGALGGGYGWSHLYYDPFYRRFLKDEYSTGAVDDAETRYWGRTSFWPEELLEELDASKDPKAPAAAARVREIIAENPGFAPDPPKDT